MRIAVVSVYHPRWDRGVSILKLQARSMTARYCTSLYLEAARKINDRKILHKFTKIKDKAIEWLQTQYDKDGLGAMHVCERKYHEYLVTSRDYLKKGECQLIMWDYLNETFDETAEKHGEVWIEVKKQCLRKTAIHDNLVTGNDDRRSLSTKALASLYTIVAKVLFVSMSRILDKSLGVEFLTMRVGAPNSNE